MSAFSELKALLSLRGLETDPTIAEEIAKLYDDCRPSWLDLLAVKPKSAQSRAKVEQERQVQLEGYTDPIPLDLDPDVRLAILLSDELGLDEIECVRLLIGAQDLGDLSAERAAGLWYEARHDELSCLIKALQAECLGQSFQDSWGRFPDASVSEALALVSNKNQALLEEKDSGGRLRVLGRLLTLIEESMTPSARGTQITVATDDEGNTVPRDLLACREATLACEGVFFACFLRPSLVRGFQQEAERILSAACTLSKAASVAPPTTAGTLTHQANLLLVSMLCLLSPPLDADGAPAEEAATKADVARFANAIAPALERCGPGADTGLAAVLVLALAAVGPATASSINMRGGLREACAAGALGYLRDKLMSSSGFQDDILQHQELIVTVLHSLLHAVFDFKPGNDLLREMVSDVPLHGSGKAHTGASAMDVDSGGHKGDSLVTLLDLLRDMFSVYVERSPTEHLDSYMPIVKAAEMRSSESPPVMVAYLGMLGGLASAAPGAKWVQEWMVTSNSDITWDRMFSYLHTYCDMLQQDPSSAGAAPLALHLPRPESAMPQEDAVGLAAFADVLAKVVNNMEDAALEPMREVLSRLSRVNRAWDVALFDLMCYRIPSVLKAALMRSLAAVVAHPASDPLANPHGILQSLHEAEILRNDLRPGAVHYDIRYQLEEVEARTERYPETLAFVKLLNALFSRCPVGPECARYTLFVTEIVLGKLNQRTFQDACQKWELAEACAQHMTECLASASSWAGTPGAIVMADVLGRGPAMGTLLQVVGVGSARLALMRETGLEGTALERALHAALDLLAHAFECDSSFLSPTRDAAVGGRVPSQGPFFQPLDRVLILEMRRLPRLFECVGYSYEPAIQTAALRVILPLTQRESHLVPLLVQAGHHLPRIIKGFARCMDEALESAPTEADPRAALLLRILNVAASKAATPNLAHLLLGYSVEMGVDVGLANPLTEFTALQAILKGLPVAVQIDVPLSEQMLALLATLVSRPATRDVTLDALRQDAYQLLLPLLPDILADIPTGSPPAHHAAALRRRTHVMRIFLQELFFASREGTHPASANATLGPEILKALFASPDSEGPSAAAEPAAVRLLRATAAGAHMDAPDLPAALLGPLPAGVAQAVAHVAERRGVEVGGVWGVAEDGRRGVDQRTLQEQVAAAARDGGVSEDVWSGLMWYAEALTSAEEELWCRSQLFEAWRSVVEVSFTLCFQQVLEATGTQDPQLAVFRIARASLDVLPSLFALEASVKWGSFSGGSVAVASTVAVLMTKLRELQAGEVAMGVPGSDAPQLDEANLRDLLRRLLSLQPPASPAIRTPLCIALLQALHYCRSPEAAPPVPDAAAQSRGVRSAEQADRAVAAEVSASSVALVSHLRESVFAPDPRLRAAALHVAGAAAAADASGAVREELFRREVPRAILRSVAAETPGGLASAAPAELWAVEAQLALLQMLAGVGRDLAGQRGAARQLFQQAALRHLGNCRACDLRPEPLPAPGTVSDAKALAMPLRDRSHRVVTPILRLAVSIAAALPESADVAADTKRFVSEHAATLVRIIEDACDIRAGGSCTEGIAELQEADLVLQLACLLGPLDSTSPLHAALGTLAEQLLRDSSSSPNRFVSALRSATMAQASDTVAAHSLKRAIQGLRASLVRYLLLHARNGTLRLPPLLPPSSHGALRVDLLSLTNLLSESIRDLSHAAARRDGARKQLAGSIEDPRAVLAAAVVPAPRAALDPQAPRELVEAAARGVAAATERDGQRGVAVAVGMIEALLEVVLGELRAVAGGDKASTLGQGPEGAGWGVLRRTLPDVLKVLSPTKGAASAEPWVVAGHSVAQDASALADMVRQTRELLRQGL